MTTCGARFSPSDDQLSSNQFSSNQCPFTFPPSPVDQPFLPWRSPPHSCLLPVSGQSRLPNSSALLDLRAKSTPPCQHHRQPHLPYPSPPRTDAALASTVPLPLLPGEPSLQQVHPFDREGFVQQVYPFDREQFVHENMSRDAARHTAPLSPPPTVLFGTTELPRRDQDESKSHRVEMWKYGESMHDGNISAPLFPPVRDDSGFEEFGPQAGYEVDYKGDSSRGGTSLIEPTSVWSLDSPLSMGEGLPLVDLPPLQGGLSNIHIGEQTSGHHDVLVSPISFSDGESNTDSWASGSSMDWSYSPSSTFVDDISAPPSPKPSGLSLDFPNLKSSLEFLPHVAISLHQPAPLSPQELPFSNGDQHWFQGETSVHPYLYSQPTPPEDDCLFLPSRPMSADLDSEYPDTVMPPEDGEDGGLPPPSPSRRLNDLHDPTLPHGDVCLTPVPRSPHGNLGTLPDLEMVDPADAPQSPHSPHHMLPELDDDMVPYSEPTEESSMDTISPSLLGGSIQPHAGLGLSLHPVSDLPFLRSPSPDDDDLGFLDIQLDPESTNLEVDEFLRLRALRKHALAQERAARMAEADLNERITVAASALLPPSHTDQDFSSKAETEVVMDPAEKRVRKRELHAMMDMRADARRMRKLQKHRSKEIGALLDFKMHDPASPMEGLPPLVSSGKGWTRSIAHLVAHMLMRRRDRSRPLENKAPANEVSARSQSPLRGSVSSEDLRLSTGSEEDEEDVMEM